VKLPPVEETVPSNRYLHSSVRCPDHETSGRAKPTTIIALRLTIRGAPDNIAAPAESMKCLLPGEGESCGVGLSSTMYIGP
jgi:hypothetical protein